MISREAGACLKAQGYAHAERKAYDLAAKDLLKVLGYDNPQSSFDAASVTEEPDKPYRTRYIDLVDQVKATSNDTGADTAREGPGNGLKSGPSRADFRPGQRCSQMRNLL